MIEIFNENGEVRDYLTVAERTPEFLAHYGPQNGYAIRSRVQSFFDMHPDIRELYGASMTAQREPSGLPAIDLTLFRFDAQLIDAEGRVVAEASALRRINTDLDATLHARLWEAGETAAFQRLMARLGFGSDTLLADEFGDMTERGTAFAPKGQTKTEAAPDDMPAEDAPAPADEVDGADSEKADTSDPESCPSVAESEEPGEREPESGPVQTPAVAEKGEAGAKLVTKERTASTSKRNTGKPAAARGEVSEALLRQIRHLASVRGIEPPEVTTKAEAKEALKTLRGTPAAS